MTLSMLRDCRVWLDEYDVSGSSNKVGVSGERDFKETTNFNSAGWVEGLAGIKKVSLDVGGFYDPSTIDAAIADLFDQASAICVLSSNDDAQSIAYISQAVILAAKRGFDVGEVATMDVQAVGTGATAFARGWILAPKSTVTASGNSSAQQNGTVSATQTVYASLHVFSVSGTTPTLDVVVQSDTVGFPSPTARITFAQATTVGAQLGSASGAITDDYWRASYTVGGTTPSFSFAVVMAIV